MILRSYLIVTGIGAFIALTMPWLVEIGLFLILPGLILGLMPTAFLYGVAFALLRRLFGETLPAIPLNLLSGVLTFALFWIVPQPGLLSARASLATAKEPDILPGTPITFGGAILVTRPFESRCDALCAALLKTPGVTSVRIEPQNGRARSYRLAPNGTPGTPATAIGYGLSEDTKSENTKYNARDPLAQGRALEAEWNLMLADGNKMLLASDDAPKADFTLAIEDGPVVRDRKRRSDWSLLPSIPERKALTLTDAGGQVLLRQSLVSALAPGAPLLIDIRGGLGSARFGWRRKLLGDRAYDALPVNRLLLEHSTIARGVDMAAVAAKTRAELAKALADPGKPADDPAFALANQWMDSFRSDQPLDSSDRQLLARILADPRVQSPDGLWAIVKRIDGDATDLRRLAARRYLAAADKKAARQWVNILARQLPKDAYADPLPEEREILATPAVSYFATGLIARQGDRGVQAVPDLLRLLRAYSVYDPGRYGASDLTDATNAVCSGLRRIGPAAASARPEIEQLLASPGLAWRYQRLGRDQWDTLLVVLGKPVDTLTKPENRSGTDASYRNRIARQAAKPYDPKATA